jgi:hypothetical protein
MRIVARDASAALNILIILYVSFIELAKRLIALQIF